MAIPATAVLWTEAMDPSDSLDFAIDCSGLLESSESITSFTVTPGPESTLLGLSIANAALVNDGVYMWLSITNPADLAFSGTGVLLPIEVKITTSSNRKWQRTAVLRVVEK